MKHQYKMILRYKNGIEVFYYTSLFNALIDAKIEISRRGCTAVISALV